MAARYTELFVFCRDGQPVHIHSERSVLERWMTEDRWLYSRDRCDITRFIPAAEPPQGLWFWGAR